MSFHIFQLLLELTLGRILFIREFSVIDAAASAEQLRLRLKDVELEEYGEAFTPEFVYEVIRRLPRFSSMRVGLDYASRSTQLLTPFSVGTSKMRKNS